jgi:hypothetical protein
MTYEKFVNATKVKKTLVLYAKSWNQQLLRILDANAHVLGAMAIVFYT